MAEALMLLVQGASRGMARTFDVTRIGVLRLAASDEPVRPSELADALDVNPSTITRSVQTLTDEGLLRVAPDPADRRSCLISATDPGRAELTRHDEAGMAVFAAVIQHWSADDVREFAQLADRLAQDWMQRGPIQSRPHRRTVLPRWKSATGDVQ